MFESFSSDLHYESNLYDDDDCSGRYEEAELPIDIFNRKFYRKMFEAFPFLRNAPLEKGRISYGYTKEQRERALRVIEWVNFCKRVEWKRYQDSGYRMSYKERLVILDYPFDIPGARKYWELFHERRGDPPFDEVE